MVKSDILKLIQDMPEDSSKDDVIYNLYILGKHKKSQQDIAEGKVYTSSQVKKLIKQ